MVALGNNLRASRANWPRFAPISITVSILARFMPRKGIGGWPDNRCDRSEAEDPAPHGGKFNARRGENHSERQRMASQKAGHDHDRVRNKANRHGAQNAHHAKKKAGKRSATKRHS